MPLFAHGFGHHHPPNEISNGFLEELDIGSDTRWIMERVGIRSRRTVLPLDYIRATRNRDPREAREAAELDNAELGARAARHALRRAGRSCDEIGLVLSGSTAPDTTTPAEACRIAARLGIDAPALDIGSACSSFVAALHLLSMMDPARLPDWILVVAPEGMTKTVDYSDRRTAVLWGDGAAAAVLSPRVPGVATLLGSRFGARPEACDKVRVPVGGHFSQEGRQVQVFAIRTMVRIVTGIREELALPDRKFHFVGHQANARALEAIASQLAIEDGLHHSNVEWFGNTGAASGASVVSGRWEKWEDRDDIALAGLGGGLSWGGVMLRFGSGEEARP